MDCYGRLFGRKEECKSCELTGYCAAAADPQLLSLHPPRLDEQLALEREDPRAGDGDAGEEEELRESFSRQELLEVIAFMTVLDESTLELLREKLGDPELSYAKLARRRKVTRQAVHKFIRDRCRKIPELDVVMRNREQRNENNLKRPFMEAVCKIRKKTHAKRSKRRRTGSNSLKNLTCSIQSFDLSKMSILRGANIWRKD